MVVGGGVVASVWWVMHGDAVKRPAVSRFDTTGLTIRDSGATCANYGQARVMRQASGVMEMSSIGGAASAISTLWLEVAAVYGLMSGLCCEHAYACPNQARSQLAIHDITSMRHSCSRCCE